MSAHRTMTTFRPSKRTILLALGGIVLTFMYMGFLEYMDHRAEGYLNNLRKTDHLAYLDELRKMEGFPTYLAAREKMDPDLGFGPGVPTFMVGRWSMRPETTRLPVGVAVDCTNPITFEFGRVRLFADELVLPAQYHLVGDTLRVRPDNRPIFNVRIVSYGSSIDHLELMPPDRASKFYAYHCGY